MSLLQSPESDSTSRSSERPKVLIPRWGRPRGHDNHYHGGIERRRVSHACEPCREKKTKCDGARPLCHHCQISGVDCYYGDGKRERAKKNLKTLENRVAVLEGLIQEVQPYLSSAGELVVQKALMREQPLSYISAPGKLPTGIDSMSNREFSQRDSGSSTGGPFFSGNMGTVGSEANANSATDSTEYLEKAGKALWMHHVGKGLKRTDDDISLYATGPPKPHGDTEVNISSREMGPPTQKIAKNSPLGDLVTSIPGRQLDMFSLPSRPVADKLINSYFTTVHPIFPIICESHFMMQFAAYYSLSERPDLQSSRKWLTVLNLVLAIGEKYLESELGVEGGGQTRDADCFTRSRILGALDGGSVFEAPDLGKVQVLGLTGMYLFASVQTNRAWNVIGLAIRLAHGIGLHLHDENTTDDMHKRMRLSVWYCLCYLETNLCLTTGRPCAIQGRTCGAPSPSALNDEILPDGYNYTSVADTYFSKHRDLIVISTDALYTLHSAKSYRDRSWSQVQDSILGVSVQLEQWRMGLPPVLDFLEEEVDLVFKRQRLSLAFQYYAIRMIINKPCLYPFEGHIPDESLEPREFRKQSAETCISSARTIIHLIVDEPNPSNIARSSPWWCLPHYLMPAKAVIMLEMVYQDMHTPEYNATLFAEGKMILGWLKNVSGENTALRRHSLELADQLKRMSPGIEDQFDYGDGDDGEEGEEDKFEDITPGEHQASLPLEPYDVREPLSEILGGPYNNTQRQCYSLMGYPMWWSPAQP